MIEGPRTCNLDLLTPAKWLINYLAVQHGIPKDVSRIVQKFSIVTYKAAVVKLDLWLSHKMYCDEKGGDSQHCSGLVFDTPYRLLFRLTAKEDSLAYLFTMQDRFRPDCVTVISHSGAEVGNLPRELSEKLISLWAMIHRYKIECSSVGNGHLRFLLVLYCGSEA